MQKMWTGIIIVGVIAIAGAAYVLSGMQGKDAQAPAKTEAIEAPGAGIVGNASDSTDRFDTEIVFTDEGFQPREAQIKKGTRVRFINKSTSTFWPASGVHPT